MSYYIWKRNNKLISYINSSSPIPPPAIKISDAEAKELGIYSPPIEDNKIPSKTDIDLLADAYRDGVNES